MSKLHYQYLATVLIIATFSIDICHGVCCPDTGYLTLSQNLPTYPKRCLDCRPVSGTYCAAGPCNIFGCNCDGPCRTVDSKECPIFIQPFPTGNVYYYVKCQTEGVCDNVSQSSQNNTTNVPESAIESPFIRSCKQKLFDLYVDSLNQMLSTESGIMEYFDCMDLNGDGKLSVDEACEELQCGARQSDFDRTIVSDDIKSLSNGKDYITAAQFDADIVAAPGSSAAHDTTAHALIALIFLSLSLFL